MDTTTLLMLMMMSGNRSMSNMLPLLLLTGTLGGQSGGSTGLTNLLSTNNLMYSMLPIGTVGTLLLGGVGALVTRMLLRPRRTSRRRRTRVIYRNRYRRRRYY